MQKETLQNGLISVFINIFITEKTLQQNDPQLAKNISFLIMLEQEVSLHIHLQKGMQNQF